MKDRLNQLPPDAPMGYRRRLEILHERKLEDTQEKRAHKLVDSDDHGTIQPPDGFGFDLDINNANGSWYGFDGWAENFYRLMDAHPVFIDPVDAFPCREMFYLNNFKPPRGFNPAYPY